MAGRTISRLFGALRGCLVILHRVTRFSTLALLVAVATSACVPKAPRQANSAEARLGAPQRGAEQASVESLLQPSRVEARAPSAAGGQVYNAGYWHWDGVRYVRIGGSTEPALPPYVWRP